MADTIQLIVSIVSLIGSVFAMIRWAVKKIKAPLDDIRADNKAQNKKIDDLTQAVARIQGDRLNQAYDHYMEKGWCSGAKKRELMDWHKAYTSAGFNHLANSYIDDLIHLPEHPPAAKGKENGYA